MKQTKTQAPTIKFIVDLKNPGDYELGWTLIQTNPKMYVSDSGEIFQGDKVIIESGLRNTVKRGSINPLSEFYNVGDRIRIITRNLDLTGIIDRFWNYSAGSQKDYISLDITVEKQSDILYRSDEFEEYSFNPIISYVGQHHVYSGIRSISKIYD